MKKLLLVPLILLFVASAFGYDCIAYRKFGCENYNLNRPFKK